MPPSPARLRIALVVDAENCGASLWPLARNALGRLGDLVAIHAVAVNSICRWKDVPGVQPFLLGPDGMGPNAADFALCCLAGQLTASGACDEVAILTGDSGFAALVRTLRLLGRGVIAMVPVRSGRVPARLVAAAQVAIVLDDAAELISSFIAPSLPDAVVTVTGDLSGSTGAWVPLPKLASALSRRGVRGLRGKLIRACQQATDLETQLIDGTFSVRPRAVLPVG